MNENEKPVNKQFERKHKLQNLVIDLCVVNMLELLFNSIWFVSSTAVNSFFNVIKFSQKSAFTSGIAILMAEIDIA